MGSVIWNDARKTTRSRARDAKNFLDNSTLNECARLAFLRSWPKDKP